MIHKDRLRERNVDTYADFYSIFVDVTNIMASGDILHTRNVSMESSDMFSHIVLIMIYHKTWLNLFD